MSALYLTSGILLGVGLTNLVLGKNAEWSILVFVGVVSLAGAVSMEIGI